MIEEQAAQTKQADPIEQKVEVKPFPMKVILGQKVGMTQIFSEKGERIPVSVILADSCTATQVKTVNTDGYNSVQLGVGTCKEKGLTKSYLGQFQKNGLKPLKWLKEFKVEHPEKLEVGQKVSVEVFSPGDYVDVSGISKGKGFAGVMKRHGFHGGPASHGCSDKARSPGSSAGGSGAPQRVLKGTRMAGRMGSDWVTTQKLEVVKVDKENQLLLVRGAIPGVSKGFVVVKETSRALKHRHIPVVAKTTKKAAAPKKPAAKAPAKAPAAAAKK